MPSKVTFSDGSTITYSYAADGTKLRMVHTISGTTTTKDYCANVVYENGIQKMLLTEEGYVDLSNSSYYYYLKDYQGNNRVVINGSGTVVETNHYYPFGGVFASTDNVQPYKYNGKELDTKKGLNWYDYGARHYDAALGRWFAVDPLAEKDYLNSPYNYCGNNPIIRVDQDGQIWETVWDFGNLLYDIGAAVVNHIKGNHDQAQSHWQDAGVDALAMAIPGLPAGVSKLKYADDVVDVAKSAKNSDGVVDVGNATKNSEKVSDISKAESKNKSINQLQKELEKGKAPKGIERFDKAHDSKTGQPHVHFKDSEGSALNKDGSWKEGHYDLSRKEIEYLRKNGWSINE